MRRKRNTNRYMYYLMIVILSLLIELSIGYFLPVMVTVCSEGSSGGMKETFDYSTTVTFLKILYLAVPIYFFGTIFLGIKDELKFLDKLNFTWIYTFTCLFTYLLFITIIDDFRDFFGFGNFAPFPGYFYYSLINGFIAAVIAGKIIHIWYNLPMEENELNN